MSVRGAKRGDAMKSEKKVEQLGEISEVEMIERVLFSYLPGAGETVITKAVPPGRGLCIALRMG